MGRQRCRRDRRMASCSSAMRPPIVTPPWTPGVADMVSLYHMSWFVSGDPGLCGAVMGVVVGLRQRRGLRGG
jgi:hypothetical protein